MRFQTGRSDCVSSLDPPYKAPKREYHPDEHFNGTMAVRFMEKEFGFSARETVVIMGAHTLGRFHQKQSAHKYVWTTDFQVSSQATLTHQASSLEPHPPSRYGLLCLAPLQYSCWCSCRGGLLGLGIRWCAADVGQVDASRSPTTS